MMDCRADIVVGTSGSVQIEKSLFEYHSDADTFHPDFEKFPLLKNAVSLNVDQHPGDLLIIPPGWYHQVDSQWPSTPVTYSSYPLGGTTR